MRTNTLRNWDSRLLQILLAEIEMFASVPEDVLESYGGYFYRALQAYGVPYEPTKWTNDELSQAERKACSRAARRLADTGLVRRRVEANRDRVTHLQLTRKGVETALAIVGDRADRSAVMEGLNRTTWGRRSSR
jgi:hypothetical protein